MLLYSYSFIGTNLILKNQLLKAWLHGLYWILSVLWRCGQGVMPQDPMGPCPRTPPLWGAEVLLAQDSIYQVASMKQLLKAWPLLDPECALELLDYQVGEK